MKYFSDYPTVCVNMLPCGELIMNASFPTIDRSCRIVKKKQKKQQNRKIKFPKCTKFARNIS